MRIRNVLLKNIPIVVTLPILNFDTCPVSRLEMKSQKIKGNDLIGRLFKIVMREFSSKIKFVLPCFS